MFTFDQRDEGMGVMHQSGRVVAHVFTRTVGETNDPNFKVQKKIVTPLPKDRWLIHFTGYKFTPIELATFLQELAAQAE